MEFDRTVVETSEWRPEGGPPSFRDTLLAVSLGVVGAIVLMYAVYRLVETTGFLLQAASAEGRVAAVSDLPMSNHVDPDWNRRLLVEFNDAQGAPQTCTIVTAFAYEAGEQIAILYPPGQPDLARLNSFWSLYGPPAILLAISLPLAFLLVRAASAMWPGGRSAGHVSAGFGGAGRDPFDDPLREDVREMTRRREAYEITDPETGESRRYDCLDAIPLEVLHRLEQMRDDMREVMNDAEAVATYSWTDESGREHMSHSLEDVPPDIRAMFERFTRAGKRPGS